MRPARPKNLATKTVAWPCASELSIQFKHGLRIQVSLHPFRSTRHPLQLIESLFDFIYGQLLTCERESNRKIERVVKKK